MRPVNLIPGEERAGERRPMRGGPLAYVVVAALALAVVGVTVLVITGNQVSDRKTEIAQLEAETAAVEARANALASYTEFHSVREARLTTVASLAQSRFDWERVMRELALILPAGDIWLTNLTGTAAAGVSVEGSSGIGLRGEAAGPALELTGCAAGQEAVAGFVQALKEIDGVTRVGVQSSQRDSTGGSGDSASASNCRTRDFIAQFQIVVAFDAAPIPVVGSTATPAPAEAAPSAEGEAAESEDAGEGAEQ
ncbi:MAG: PilN domain-containing protein [Solirubrobacterales bacterium]